MNAALQQWAGGGRGALASISYGADQPSETLSRALASVPPYSGKGDVCQRLAGRGYHVVGAGCYSHVFAHPDVPGRVVKVGPKSSETGRSDGALEYLRAATSMSSEHSPAVYHLAELPSVYVVEMEALEELQQAERNTFSLRFGRDGLKAVAEKLGAPPSYLEYAEQLHKMACLLGVRFDFHDGNTMRRPSDGTLVVTDPWIR